MFAYCSNFVYIFPFLFQERVSSAIFVRVGAGDGAQGPGMVHRGWGWCTGAGDGAQGAGEDGVYIHTIHHFYLVYVVFSSQVHI